MKKIDNQKPNQLKFAVLAADVVLFAIKEGKLIARLVAVDRPPAFPAGSKGFPGGLIHPDETADQAAARISKEKARISSNKIYFEQLYTFSDIDRDPRGRVVAVAYLALTSWQDLSGSEQSDSKETWWASANNINGLAYDHDKIFKMALERLRSRLRYTNLMAKLMPSQFTLGQLERSYEEILGQDQDKRNFRKKINRIKILKELPRKQTGEAYRPAKLYRFVSNNVKEIEIL